MTSDSRIRIDFLGKDRVKITKTSIVEAVKLLEQNPNVSLKDTSRVVIDKVTRNMWATRVGNEVTIGMAWNDHEHNSEFKEAHIRFVVEYNKIEHTPVSLSLPKKIAELVMQTNLVKVEPINDDFV